MLLSDDIVKINERLWPFLSNHVSLLIYHCNISLLLNRINMIVLPHFQYKYTVQLSNENQNNVCIEKGRLQYVCPSIIVNFTSYSISLSSLLLSYTVLFLSAGS